MPAVSLVCPHCETPVEVQVAGVTRTRPCPSCGEMLVLQTTEKASKTRRRALLMGGAIPEVNTERSLSIPQTAQKATKATAKPAAPKTEPVATKKDETAPAEGAASSDNSASQPENTEKSSSKANSDAETAEKADSDNDADQKAKDHESSIRSLSFIPSHEPQVIPGDAFERMRMDPEIREFRKRLIIGAICVVVLILVAILLAKITKGNDASTTRPPTPEEAARAAATVAPEPPPPVPAGSLVFKPLGSSSPITASPPSATGLASESSIETNLSIEALKQFLSAPDWKKRLPWCRPVEGLEDLMRGHYTLQADGPIPVENIIRGPEDEEGFYQHTVVFEGGATRPVFVQKTPKGPRVDWASFVGWCEQPWKQMQEQKPISTMLIRANVADAFYYEHQFGNPGLLKCIELIPAGPPGATSLYGYCERNSDLGRKLDFLQRQNGKKALPLTLRIKYPSSAPSPRQVWVTEIVTEGWLLP